MQEFAVVMTRPFIEQNRDNLTFGNLVVSNCQLSNTGNENASIGVAFDDEDSNNSQNIILTSNVFSGVSPNEKTASGGFYGFLAFQMDILMLTWECLEAKFCWKCFKYKYRYKCCY